MLHDNELPRDVSLKLRSALFFLGNMRALHTDKSTNSIFAQSFYFEASLFSLVGAKDTFLMYLNNISKNPLEERLVNEKSLEKHLSIAKQENLLEVVKKVKSLKEEKKSWLDILIQYRNLATHRQFLTGSMPIHDTWEEVDQEKYDGPLLDGQKPISTMEISAEFVEAINSNIEHFHYIKKNVFENVMCVKSDPYDYVNENMRCPLVPSDEFIDGMLIKMTEFLKCLYKEV